MSLADLLLGAGGIRELCLRFLKIPVAFKSSRERLSHYTDCFLSLLINIQFSAILLCCLFIGSGDLSIFSAELTFDHSNLLLGTSQTTFCFFRGEPRCEEDALKRYCLIFTPKRNLGQEDQLPAEN